MNPNQNNKYRFFRGGRGRFFYRNRGRGGSSLNKNPNSGYNDDNNKPDKTKQTTIESSLSKNCPYQGWNLYFPGQEYNAESTTAHKVRSVELFFKNNPKLYNVTTVEESRCFKINVNVLYEDEVLKSSWEDLETDLRENPNHTLSCIGLAMHQVVLTKLKEEMEKDETVQFDDREIQLPMIRARISDFGPIVLLKNLKSNYFGKLITVKGTVIRVGNIKLTCTWMAFQCDKCETVQCFKQSDGIYTLPTSCPESKCKSKSFTPLLSSPHTQTLSWQCVRLQEIVSDEHGCKDAIGRHPIQSYKIQADFIFYFSRLLALNSTPFFTMRKDHFYRTSSTLSVEGGRVPRSIDCELTSDLVESCSPGDVAIVTGIIKIRNSEEGSKQKNSNMFLQYMDVVSVSNLKNRPGAGASEVEFNMKNYYAIKEIHSEKNLFRLIVQSLCPSIFGHEIVKAGLILAMFGGCQRYEECRADPHVLVVGDPGLGKSRMLQACASVAPRGVYVCGNTSTVSGLTVTLAREGGDYVLEAGALVLSDQGCCCIDEFDKMTSQHQALLEAMEQQTVSIAKSGVICALPCRASILAAANPVGGHYNKAKTISENLKLGPSLLSRFDLVFILLDQPSVQADSMLSDHVMAMHLGLKGSSTPTTLSGSFNESSTSVGESLLDRLKVQPGEELDLIPHQLLRKYIAYAKKYVQPKLTEEASELLMKFYMELRKCHQDSDSTPVTPRQLESLIRFTEARAKLELRVEATAEDAHDVIEILRHSLLDMFSDNYGYLDFQRSQNGSGTSSKNQAKKFISALQRLSELQARSVFSTQELKEVAKNASISVNDFSNFLMSLNVQGFLLKKGSQLYQLLSAD